MNFKQFFLLMLLISVCLQVRADEFVAKEHSIKAAFLYNFAVYTDWPSLPDASFKFCVLDSPAMLDALQIIKVKQIKSHPVEVIALGGVAQAAACQVLFVGTQAHVDLSGFAQTPLLVVADEGLRDLNHVTIVMSRQQDRFATSPQRVPSRCK